MVGRGVEGGGWYVGGLVVSTTVGSPSPPSGCTDASSCLQSNQLGERARTRGLHAHTKHKFLSRNFRGKGSLKILRNTDASPPTDTSLTVPLVPLYGFAPVINTRFPINLLWELSFMALESAVQPAGGALLK